MDQVFSPLKIKRFTLCDIINVSENYKYANSNVHHLPFGWLTGWSKFVAWHGVEMFELKHHFTVSIVYIYIYVEWMCKKWMPLSTVQLHVKYTLTHSCICRTHTHAHAHSRMAIDTVAMLTQRSIGSLSVTAQSLPIFVLNFKCYAENVPHFGSSNNDL